MLVIHTASRNRTSWDSRWTIHTAMSMLREGNTDLDEYRPLLERNEFYAVERVGGHWYCRYPPGAALAALPFVAAAEGATALVGREPLSQFIRGTIPHKFEAGVASALVAIAAVMVYLLARRRLSVAGALAVAAVFAFGTPAWSTASRAMWQHTPAMLMVLIAMVSIPRSEDSKGVLRPAGAALAGVALAFAFVCRPTAAVPAAMLGLYVYSRYRRQCPWMVLPALAVLVLFTAHSLRVWEEPLPPYYLGGLAKGQETRFVEALAGHWVSPNRGLLVTTPIVLAAFAGAAVKLRRRRFDLLDGLLAACVAAHWLIVSAWPVWWGGHCLGPRMMTDVLPMLVPFAAFALAAASELPARRRVAAIAALVLLAGASVAVHGALSNNPGALQWNVMPRNVDARPQRVWDWDDLPFLREKT